MGRLRDGEWVAGAGGLALLAAMFLHWYGAGPFEATAWQAFDGLDVVLALLALVPLGLVVTQATRASLDPRRVQRLHGARRRLAALLILYRIANQPGRTTSWRSSSAPGSASWRRL